MTLGSAARAVIGLLVGLVVLQTVVLIVLVLILVEHMPRTRTEVEIVGDKAKDPFPVTISNIVKTKIQGAVIIDDASPIEVEVNNDPLPVKIER